MNQHNNFCLVIHMKVFKRDIGAKIVILGIFCCKVAILYITSDNHTAVGEKL